MGGLDSMVHDGGWGLDERRWEGHCVAQECTVTQLGR